MWQGVRSKEGVLQGLLELPKVQLQLIEPGLSEVMWVEMRVAMGVVTRTYEL